MPAWWIAARALAEPFDQPVVAESLGVARGQRLAGGHARPP
ncbi:hypothetical protein [Actinomadura darangshiensis]|nr:hypothetical protein [Actinomadura darangshiensis]